MGIARAAGHDLVVIPSTGSERRIDDVQPRDDRRQRKINQLQAESAAQRLAKKSRNARGESRGNRPRGCAEQRLVASSPAPPRPARTSEAHRLPVPELIPGSPLPPPNERVRPPAARSPFSRRDRSRRSRSLGGRRRGACRRPDRGRATRPPRGLRVGGARTAPEGVRSPRRRAGARPAVAAPVRIAAGSGTGHAVAARIAASVEPSVGEQRPDQRGEHVDGQRRHVAAGDDDDRLLGGLEARRAARRAGRRAAPDRRRDGRARRRDPAANARRPARRRRSPRRDRARRAATARLEEAPALELGGELVRPEPARRAAGEDDPADASSGRRVAATSVLDHGRRFERGARGPGTWPSGVRRRIARRSRSSRMRHHVLAARPGRVAKAAGVSGAAAASASAWRCERRGTSERREARSSSRTDDPALRLEGPDRGRRAAGVDAPRPRAAAAPGRRAAARGGPSPRAISGEGPRSARPGVAEAVAVARERPPATRRSIAPLDEVGRGVAGSSVTWCRSSRATSVRSAARETSPSRCGAIDRRHEPARRSQADERPARAPDGVRRRAVQLEAGRRPRVAERRGGRQRHEPVRGRAAARGATRRVGVEHPAAGERAAGDGRRSTNRSPGAIAIGSARRRIATSLAVRQLGAVAAAPPDGRLDAGRPGMDQHPGADPRQRAGRLGAAVASDGAGRRATRIRSVAIDRRVASVERRAPRAIDAASTPARLIAAAPGPRPGRPSRPWTWSLADPDAFAPGHEPQRVAAVDRAAAQAAGDDGAASADAEDAVDREPRPAAVGIGPARATTGREARRAPPGRRRAPSPVTPDATRTGAPRSVVRASSARTAATTSPTRSASTASAFVTTASPTSIAERVEELEMLERLGPRPVVGGHDEQRRVDLARPDEHVADQPVVAGHVDEVELGAVVEREVGVPDVDRHPPRAAPRAAGPRRSRSAPGAASSCRGRCGRQSRRRRSSAGARSRIRRAIRSASSATGRRSAGRRRPRPCSIRPMTGGVADAQPGDDPLRRRRRDREPGRRQRLPGSEPPPTVASVDDATSVASRRARPRSGAARASSSSTARAIIRQTGISDSARAGRGTARASRRRRRASTLSGRIARASGSRRIRATRSARPTTKPGLRPADELVAAERDDVRAGGEPLRGHRLVARARSAAVGEQRAGARGRRGRSRRGDGRSRPARPRRRVSVKPCLAEVRRVDAQDGPRRAAREDLLEVRDPRPVRRPDLDQLAAGPPDDLRDPDAAADLDELAARHGHAAPAARPARPRAPTAAALLFVTSASSAPVSATRCSSACAEPRAAAAGPAVELEEQVGAGGRRGGLDRRARPRRAPEVRVDDHAGRVDHGLEAHRARASRAGRRRRRRGRRRSAARRPRRAARARPRRRTGRPPSARRDRRTHRAPGERRPSTASTLGGRGLVSVAIVLPSLRDRTPAGSAPLCARMAGPAAVAIDR